MFIKLLVLFTIVPLVEVYLLLQVGTLIGPAPTIALILTTGFAGAYLARSQGFEILHRLRADLLQGAIPTAPLIDGALILVGGVLLLTPGLCTDLLGFTLLVPLTRAGVKHLTRRWLQNLVDQGTVTIRRR